jgi:hypothetical protein
MAIASLHPSYGLKAHYLGGQAELADKAIIKLVAAYGAG